MTFLWNGYDTQVRLLKPGCVPLELSVGDVISLNIYPEGVKIVKFYGVITEQGPRGFTYIPWNSKEQKWANPPQSIRVDPRYILCEPAGVGHYGTVVSSDYIHKLENNVFI